MTNAKKKGRPAIYTPEEAKTRADAQKAEYKRENMSSINVRVLHVDKARYAAYAKHKGLPIATMFRACAEDAMRAEGWTWTPETPEEWELVKADADRRRGNGETIEAGSADEERAEGENGQE